MNSKRRLARSMGVTPPSQRGGRRESSGHGEYDPDDTRYVAMHEAGHSVAAVVLGIGMERVDIKRRRFPNGLTSVGYTKMPMFVEDIAGRAVVLHEHDDSARPSNRPGELVDPPHGALGVVPRRIRAEQAHLHVDHEERGPRVRERRSTGVDHGPLTP